MDKWKIFKTVQSCTLCATYFSNENERGLRLGHNMPLKLTFENPDKIETSHYT